MIGFFGGIRGEEVQTEEGPETKNLSKNELYDLVASRFLLPMYSSKGMTREYLLQVNKDEVFRVPIMDFKRFEFPLTPGMQKRVGILNNAFLVKKVNLFLQLTGRKPLGFSEYDIPEQTWLYKVARFIDPSNILEFFEEPVHSEPPLDERSTQVTRVYYGRIYASEYLYRSRELKNNRKLWDAVRSVSDAYRGLMSAKVNIDILRYELEQAVEKQRASEAALNDLVSKATITYTSIENPQIKADLIMAGGDALTAEQRKAINTNFQM